jgi:hypothetical protein
MFVLQQSLHWWKQRKLAPRSRKMYLHQTQDKMKFELPTIGLKKGIKEKEEII